MGSSTRTVMKFWSFFPSLSFDRSGDAFRADGQVAHLSFGQVLFELAVRDRLHFRGKKVLLHQGKQEEDDQEIPDTEVGLGGSPSFFLWGS